MLFSDLFHQLCNCTITPINMTKNNVYITKTKLLTPDIDSFSESTIYFGSTSNLPILEETDQTFNFILYGEKTHIPDEYFKGNHNLIHISTEENIFSIFNQIEELLEEERAVQPKLEPIYEVLLNNRGLQSIVNMATNLFGNPVFIIDQSYRYICVSSNVDFQNELMIKEKNAGYIFKENVNHIHQFGIDRKIKKFDEPYYFVNPLFNKGMLVDTIRIGNVDIGHVMVYELQRAINEKDKKLLRQFSNIVSLELQKDPFYIGNKGNKFSYILGEILDSKIQDAKRIKDRMDILNYQLKEYLYILTIKPKKYVAPLHFTEKIMKQIRFLFPDCLEIVYKDSIVVLLNFSREIDLKSPSFQSLGSFLKENNLICGISNPFHELLDIKKSHFQSVTALKIGLSYIGGKHIFFYNEVVILHILNLCDGCVDDLISLCHPSVMKLLTYDQRNNTELAKTLYLYIRNPNTKETANILHIHKNTLLYRINKIKELLHTNLDNAHELFHFHLSFIILLYKGILNDELIMREIKSYYDWF